MYKLQIVINYSISLTHHLVFLSAYSETWLGGTGRALLVLLRFCGGGGFSAQFTPPPHLSLILLKLEACKIIER